MKAAAGTSRLDRRSFRLHLGRGPLQRVSLVVLLLGLTLYAFEFISQKESTDADVTEDQSNVDVDVNDVDIALSIQRFKKVSSMTSLTKEIYESNFVALDEASKRPNTTTYTALEIIVNKNRQDLASHSDKLIEILRELSEMSESMPEVVEAEFDAAIVGAEQSDSTEAARLLKLGQKIIRHAPSEGDRTGYLQNAINNTL
ncbi:MAG: hypothetical protein AAGC99_05505 [Pseudomonadota bacterium]